MSYWSLVIGAGAKSVESNGKEVATGTVPDGAQVSGEDVEESVHPVTPLVLGVGSDVGAGVGLIRWVYSSSTG